MKPRPSARTTHATYGADALQPPKRLDDLPLGAVALGASQPASQPPVTTLPSAHVMDAHARAARHAALEAPVAQNATEPQLSATQQQTVQPNSSSKTMESAVLAQSPAFSSERHQPVVPHQNNDSGLPPAAVDADLDNDGPGMPANAATSSQPSPAPTAAVRKDSAVLMSMLSSGKRSHSVLSQQGNYFAELMDRTESLREPLRKKPKAVLPGQ